MLFGHDRNLNKHAIAGIFKEINFAPCADYGLLSAAVEASNPKAQKPCGRDLFIRRIL